MKERAPQAFAIEYEGKSTDQALYDDIVSYLGEYRLNVPKYSYKLRFGGASFDDLHVRNIYDGEPAYESARRAIREREKKGLPTHREQAELAALGDPDNVSETSLSWQLRFAEDGDTVVWASPPGPKEEGYGDYGFMFIGRYSKKGMHGGDLEMTAIRIENPTLFQYNCTLGDLTGTPISFIQADTMLAQPFVINGTIEEWGMDSILRKNFNFAANYQDQLMFQRVIKDMEPSIAEFMRFVKTGTRREKLPAFQTLEKYALGLYDQYKKQGERIVYLSEHRPYIPIEQLVGLYGDKELPTVAGSCGASSTDIKSNNPFANRFENLMKTIFGNSINGNDDEEDESYEFNKYGDCVVCTKKAMVGPCDICKSCDSNLRAKK